MYQTAHNASYKAYTILYSKRHCALVWYSGTYCTEVIGIVMQNVQCQSVILFTIKHTLRMCLVLIVQTSKQLRL